MRYLLHSSLQRRMRDAGVEVTRAELVRREVQLLKEARDAGYGYRDGRVLLDSDLLARLQHAGASTSLLDVTPDPFVALFFATEPRGEPKPCALIAIKVPGKTEAEQQRHTLKGPLADGWAVPGGEDLETDGIYEAMRQRLKLPVQTSAPILWEAPFVDDRMRAQRGMFIATTAPPEEITFTSFDVVMGTVKEEQNRVKYVCERNKGKYTRPSLVVFYLSAKLRHLAARELDRRFGYRTETIYPDLAGFAEANAANRAF